tara:strand:+ start:203 stop:352 length:150 start_codon:yes stop_codon:yes gene_type:complete
MFVAPPCWALGAGVQGGGTQPPSLSSMRGGALSLWLLNASKVTSLVAPL